jgi:uncharacterized protein YndB with AHSA1/START domain
MLKKFLITFAILIPIIIGLLFLLPSGVKIRRSVEINAPAAKIYPFVANLKQWSLWAPWKDQLKGDLKIDFSYEGPQQGEGAIMRWKDPKQRGGSIKILKAEQNRSIEYVLTMDDGAEAKGAIILSPKEGNKTSASWLDELDVGNNLLARFFIWTGIFTEQVEQDFDKGLNGLKDLVEKGPQKKADKKDQSPNKNLDKKMDEAKKEAASKK